MPKFGWCRFAEDKYGQYARYHNLKFRMFGTVPLGMEVRRTIGKIAGDTSKAVTFRIRRGNGSYGSVSGKRYQDKYKYPGGINIDNPEGEPYRRQWIAAVHKWKYDLTADQKKAYNSRAIKGLRMSGYNLFMREAMKGLVEMFINRGDPANYDFEIGDFTQDNAWHDLSLATIIPLGAALVLLDADYNNVAANRHIELRKNGQTNNKNHAEVHTRVAAQDDHAIMVVAPDASRVIEYKVSTAGWSVIAMTIRGWWT